jgi:nucleoside-diphosphate-sugar epimerase
MKILIVGASGFIGSHLKEYLQKHYPQYILLIPSHNELDLVDECAVDQYISDKKIDIIIHAANRGGGRDTMDMKNITEYNLRVFFNIAKHEKNVQKIISFGSGAEYAKHKPIVDVREEDYLHCLPLDEYGFYKSITSRYIEKADKIVQLRVFGCYGEYENYRFKFISNAIVKNLLQLPITINKNVFFDYIYVDDLLRMIDYCLHHEMKDKIYNASRGEKIDLLALAQMINESADFKSDIITVNGGLNNEYTSNADKIISEMGGFEFTSHADAIVKIREYFKQNLDQVDTTIVKEDPYLKVVDTIWKP